jgi:hypothetical protein
MAYVIIPNAERRAKASELCRSYGYSESNKAMYEVAETAAARTDEAVKKGHDMEQRRFY